MKIVIDLDTDLIEAAAKALGTRTKEDTIHTACGWRSLSPSGAVVSSTPRAGQILATTESWQALGTDRDCPIRRAPGSG